MSVPARTASPEAGAIPVIAGTDDELYVLGLAGLKHVFGLHIESAPAVYSVENAMEWVESTNNGQTYLVSCCCLRFRNVRVFILRVIACYNCLGTSCP